MPPPAEESDGIWRPIVAIHELADVNPYMNTSATAAMARTFSVLRLGDMYQIGTRRIVVSEQMLADAKTVLGELAGYEGVKWIFAPIYEENACDVLCRMNIAIQFLEFWNKYLRGEPEPEGLGLIRRALWRLGLL